MQEKKINNSPESPNSEEMNKALQQMKYSICKIFKANGTGFFCFIPYENKFIKVLITNYHVIKEQYIKENDYLTIGINDEKYINAISLNGNRKIYFNEEYDLAMIEITDKDQLNSNIVFLNLDNDLFQKNSESIYSTKIQFILFNIHNY